MPSDMKTTVPRIKETDIQVMNDVVGKGKFGNVNRGFIKKGTRNTEVAFKTLRGNGGFTLPDTDSDTDTDKKWVQL